MRVRMIRLLLAAALLFVTLPALAQAPPARPPSLALGATIQKAARAYLAGPNRVQLTLVPEPEK